MSFGCLGFFPFRCRKYGLEHYTIYFIGRALALHLNDSYLDQPAMDFVKRIKVTFIHSISTDLPDYLDYIYTCYPVHKSICLTYDHNQCKHVRMLL